MAMLFPFSVEVSNSFALVADEPIDEDLGRDAEKTFKKVKFAKKENKVANRHGKYPSYMKHFPYYLPVPVTEFLSAEAAKHCESWGRSLHTSQRASP